ncbi:MAG: putative toxin-antitoxin system toxin component, PIN family [Patescibacteria group bacterium]
MTSLIKFKAVVDTNVFISGLIFDGLPLKVIEAIQNKKVLLVTSAEIELEILLKLAKFNYGQENIVDLKQQFEKGALRVVPKSKVDICRDLKDNKFLEAALESRADFLVSGDKDLLTLKTFHKTQIITPKEFLSKFNK